MAFFGLTQLGYQDTIREHVKDNGVTPQHIFRSGLYRESPYNALRETKAETCEVNELLTTGYAGTDNSQKDLRKRLLVQRYQHEPTEVYRRPLTTSAEIGKWHADDPLKEKEPWTEVKMCPIVSSEISRFVNDMLLTNRDFSLY